MGSATSGYGSGARDAAHGWSATLAAHPRHGAAGGQRGDPGVDLSPLLAGGNVRGVAAIEVQPAASARCDARARRGHWSRLRCAAGARAPAAYAFCTAGSGRDAELGGTGPALRWLGHSAATDEEVNACRLQRSAPPPRPQVPRSFLVLCVNWDLLLGDREMCG
ncbi:unnamed protein product [Urochloa humidicola]